ncbi:MAG TPA: DUF11 domain-containing protein [Pirellulaceae bacterium]|nr:DUF11 domain-containing protein [Pirellulaceae bacterium]
MALEPLETRTLLAADLAVTKTDALDPVPAGGTINYTLTIVNNGPDAAANVVLSDPIPVNTSFQFAEQTSGPDFQVAFPGFETLEFSIASLAAGASLPPAPRYKEKKIAPPRANARRQGLFDSMGLSAVIASSWCETSSFADLFFDRTASGAGESSSRS